MIIQLEKQYNTQSYEQLQELLIKNKIGTQLVSTHQSDYLVTKSSPSIDPRIIGSQSAVADVFSITDTYQFVSSQWKIHPSEIKIDDSVSIGNGNFQVMSGPCSIENEAQVEKVAKHYPKITLKSCEGEFSNQGVLPIASKD